jgi:hypothetical protein
MCRNLIIGLLAAAVLSGVAASLHADPGDPLPPPTVLTQPVVPSVVRPLTVEEFVKGFKPQAGKCEVVLIHPKSCCPVRVCFDLPDGCPCKVRWTRHVLEFDYPRCSVRIRFYHNGSVRVFS